MVRALSEIPVRATLLGHASVLVQAAGRAVLIDPVFHDPWGEGAVTSCPARRVHPERLPRADGIVLTDAAVDRLDIATLARLPRGAIVACPKDRTVLYVLRRLGFPNVRPLDPGAVLALGEGVEIVATPSLRKVPEIGVIVRHQGRTMWHAAATQLTPDRVAAVRSAVGRIDLLLAAFATQDFSYVGMQRAGFPGQFLRNAIACARVAEPAMVVPWSAGFRFVAPFEWTNAFLFPISRDRFLAELRRAAPNVTQAIGNPGDVLEIAPGQVNLISEASPVAEMIEDDSRRVEFDPTVSVPPITDPNTDGYSMEVLEREVASCMDGFAESLRAAYASDPLVAEHRKVAASYGVGVVFPGGAERWLRVDFDPQAPRIAMGDGTLRGPLVMQRIAASVLTARARYERRHAFEGGLARVTVVSPAQLVDNRVVVTPRQPPDLLMHYIRNRPPGWAHHLRQILDFRLAPFLGEGTLG